MAVNDRILEVNNKSMVNISHETAVTILKGTGKDVKIKVEKGSIPPPEVIHSPIHSLSHSFSRAFYTHFSLF